MGPVMTLGEFRRITLWVIPPWLAMIVYDMITLLYVPTVPSIPWGLLLMFFTGGGVSLGVGSPNNYG